MKAAVLLLLWALGAPALAAPASPVLRDAWIALPPPGARVAAAYLVLDNRAGPALVVTGARVSGFARAEVHETVRDGDRSAMRARPTLAVGAGTTVEFAPGGLHLMLWDAAAAPTLGGRHEISLALADGRTLVVTAEVRDRRVNAPAHH